MKSKSKRRSLPKLVNASLAQLTRAELVRLLQDAEVTYIFKHALVQDIVYAALLKNDRQHLHRRVAQTLEFESRNDLDANAARLAQHYAAAGDDAKTLEFAKRAGDRAARVYALPEAVTYYTQALEIATRARVLDTPLLIELYRARGQALYSIALWQESWANYEEMERVAMQHADRALELYMLVERALLRALFSPLYDPADAQNLAARALALATELNERTVQAKLLWIQMILHRTDEPQRAVADGEQSLALAQELGLREQFAYTLTDLQYPYRSVGRTADALRALEQARPLWRELGNQHMVADNLNQTAFMHYASGELARGKELAQDALTLSQQTSNQFQAIASWMALGMIEVERGNIVSALENFQPVQTDTNPLSRGWFAAQVAGIYAQLGVAARGIELLQATLPQLLETPLGKIFGGPLYGILARLQLAVGNLAEAERAFEPIASQYRAWNYSALGNGGEQATFAAAELAMARGDNAHAQKILAELIALLEQLELFLSLPEARLLQARAWIATCEWDKAFGSLVQARAEAERMGLVRVLWHIDAALMRVERVRGNFEAADEYRIRAREGIEYIVARVPQEFRETFLNMARVREVMA